MTEWRKVAGFPLYEVSNEGQVRSWHSGAPRLLRGGKHPDGYPNVLLFRGDGTPGRTSLVHRLVAEAFLGAPPPAAEVRHIDGDPTNPHLSNLEYGTHSQNQLDQVRHGRHIHARKNACPAGHPYDELNTRWTNGKRVCRTCHRLRERERSRRKAEAASGHFAAMTPVRFGAL